MKNIELHPLSALLGAGIAVLATVALGAQSQYHPSPSPFDVPKVVEHVVKVKGVPAEAEMWSSIRKDLYAMQPFEDVVIYTVPLDKRLVITHWPSVGDSVYVWLGWNGVASKPLAHRLDSSSDHTQIKGLAFPPGSDVILQGSIGGGDIQERLYGYLADA